MKDLLISKIKIVNDCWEWQFSLRSGYGALKIKGKVCSTHRLSYETFIGIIPKGMFVCHKCDNRKCINPDHLFIGSQKDNMRDCLNKKRMFIPKNIEHRFKNGNKPHNSKIDHINIKLIKTLINKGERLIDISNKLNISYQLIKDIKRGKSYSNT